jgi:hypothetical protein
MTGPKIDRICEICGNPFKARIRDIRRKGWGRFCSINCANKFRATGKTNPNYILGHKAYDFVRLSKIYRQEIRERDGYKCKVCGNTSHLHVHHIIPIRDGGGDEANNLMTLCCRCHNRVEHGRSVDAFSQDHA